ncbi:MAG: hypothetical protein ACXACI_07320 [Candidatus Hodarchaeales archaeon]|jgi:chromosome segregation ATPase
MAQRKEMASNISDVAKMIEAVDVAQEQLNQSLINIAEHLLRLSKAGDLSQDRMIIEKSVNKIVTDEFKIISTFLEQVLYNSIEATLEENERLTSTLQRLRPELLELETERDQFAQEAYDLKKKNQTLQQKLLEITKSMAGLAAKVKALKSLNRDYEKTRTRLFSILEKSENELVSQQVERLIGLLLKAGYKIQQAQQRRSKLEEESFRLRKTYEAVSVLSEHDSTSRMIIILAEMDEIDIDHLAEITGQKKILMKHQLRKWANRGLVRISQDGRAVSLTVKKTKLRQATSSFGH